MQASMQLPEGGRPRAAPVLATRVPTPEDEAPGDASYAHLVHQATLAASVADAPLEPIREQDRLLPAANIFRIIQRELPEGCKISRDAKYFMQVRRLPGPRRARYWEAACCGQHRHGGASPCAVARQNALTPVPYPVRRRR
jgi:hypothetical protein